MTAGLKTGGRVAGTPNKRTTQLLDQLQERFPGYHPVIAMAEMANDANVAPEVRLDCHKQIAPYVVPKLKALEVSGVDGDPLDLLPEINLHETARRLAFMLAKAAHEQG